MASVARSIVDPLILRGPLYDCAEIVRRLRLNLLLFRQYLPHAGSRKDVILHDYRTIGSTQCSMRPRLYNTRLLLRLHIEEALRNFLPLGKVRPPPRRGLGNILFEQGMR